LSEYSITYELAHPEGLWSLTFNPARYATGVMAGVAPNGLYLSDVSGLSGEVRGGAENLPQRDGAYVFDGLAGAAFPTLTGYIRADSLTMRNYWIDMLKGRTDQTRREDAYLTWTPSGLSASRRLTVRLAQRAQISGGPGPLKTFQVQFVAGDPVPKHQEEAVAFSTFTQHGGSFGFPFSFPMTFGYDHGGSAIITPGGNVPTYPRLVLIGPISSPILSNQTTGQVLSLPGLVLPATHQISIDMRTEQMAEITDQLVPCGNGVGALDVQRSDFWSMLPGVPNEIRVSGTGVTAGTGCQINWGDAWA
jgi:hypothetical protein